MIYLLYRMQHDRFLEASSLLQPYLYQQLSLQEFAHSPVDELLRNPRYLMHLLRRISRFTLVEAMANQMHHHGADLDAVLQLHMVVLQIQIVMMQILIGIAEQGSEYHYRPRNLKPQQEKRNRCQRTVDDVVAGKEHLQIDVAILQCRHADTCQERWHQGASKPDIGVRNHAIAEHEEEEHRDECRQMQEKRRNRLAHIGNLVYIVYHIHRPYIDERRKENHHAKTEEDGWILGNNLLPRTLARMPDVVEGKLYLLHQRDDGIEKHHDTRTDDIVALRVLYVIMNEVHDGLSHNGLRLESARNPRFEQGGVTEATGNDKHHRHKRNQRHERGEGQRRHIPSPHILDVEDATSEHTHLDPRLQLAPEILDIGRIELPDILVKAYDSVYYSH